MPLVKFILPGNEVSEVDGTVGESVMEMGKRAGIEQMIGECGGSLSCATCHVYVEKEWWDRLPPVSYDEADLLEVSHEPGPTSRLSCQIFMTEELDGLTVTMPLSQS